MEWVIIIGLVLVGAFLIILEIFFVPGSTIIGVLGLICTSYGVYLGFSLFGKVLGGSIFVFVLLLNLVVIFVAFKSKSWEWFALKNINLAKFNDEYHKDIQIGQRGITISVLRPIGKALLNDFEVEVSTKGDFLDENVEIEVYRIESTKIYVKPINI